MYYETSRSGVRTNFSLQAPCSSPEQVTVIDLAGDHYMRIAKFPEKILKRVDLVRAGDAQQAANMVYESPLTSPTLDESDVEAIMAAMRNS